MPWLLSMLIAVTGIHFDQELARLTSLAPLELRLILTGVLLGLGIVFVMGEIDARALARKRRHAPPLSGLGSG